MVLTAETDGRTNGGALLLKPCCLLCLAKQESKTDGTYKLTVLCLVMVMWLPSCGTLRLWGATVFTRDILCPRTLGVMSGSTVTADH